ncbi:hypothetical protein BDZ91DRAFT_790605 [Kalaharituber pfeilii]|nr:hypothetical protein BDZ91DRAFT_790605 [Kalaharituber pfeilii]
MPRRPPLPIRLFADFDGTLTTKDTLTALASLPPSPRKPFSYFTAAYLADLGTYLPSLPTPIPPNVYTTPSQEVAYLSAYTPLERRSIERVEAYRHFANIYPSELRAHGARSVENGTITVRKGWWELVYHLLCSPSSADSLSTTSSNSIAIISVNWSSEFITGVLHGSYSLWAQSLPTPPPPSTLPSSISVHSNTLVLSPTTSHTTGLISRTFTTHGIWTASDKLAIMHSLLPTPKSQSQSHSLTIYVGDSPTDLPCLLRADVGFVLGCNQTLEETCKRMGLKIVDGCPVGAIPPLNAETLMQSSWDEELRDVDVSKKALWRVGDFEDVRKWIVELGEL